MLNDKRFTVPLFFSIVYITPFILLNNFYRDDYARVMRGYFKWTSDGRPLTDIIIKLVTFGDYLTPISPLSYVLISIMFSATCYIITKHILNTKSIVQSISVMMLFISPLFIQNLSYRFDSLTMTASILLLSIPFCNDRRNNFIIITTILCCILSLLTYQASIPSFFYFLLCYYLFSENENKNKNSLIMLACASFSIAIYTFILSDFFISGNYASNRIGDIGDTSSYISNAFSNILVLYDFFNEILTREWAICLFVPFLCLTYTIIKKIISRGNKALLIVILLSCMLSSLMFFIIKKPVFSPRVMIWANALCMVAVISTIKTLNGKLYKIGTFFSIIPVFYCYTVVNSYYNAVSFNEQKQLSITNLIQSEYGGKHKKIMTYYAPVNTEPEILIYEKNPILNKIINSDFNWGNILHYLTIKNPSLNGVSINYHDFTSEGSVMIDKWNGFYCAFSSDGDISIIFKKELCD